MLGVGFRLGLATGAGGGWRVSGMKEVISCWMAAWPGGVVSQASMLETWIRVAWLITSWALEEVGSSGMSAVSVIGRRWSVEGRLEKYLAGITGWFAVERGVAIVVLGGKPACHDIRIKVINGFEVIIGKAGIELKKEMVARGEGEG